MNDCRSDGTGPPGKPKPRRAVTCRMAEQRERRIVDGELLDEPHIRGRRVSVLRVHDRVIKHGVAAEAVADRLGLSPADVHHALAYYYENPQRMQELEDERERLRDAADDTGNGPVSVE